ncbi:MAG: cell division protein ZapA [Bacteroidales bacterium]|nr:cell division protein ZapA [Lentimicrobiaceae bacterium]MDD5694449.1 cell division protein ZapA [Bacteroidales bacterium]
MEEIPITVNLANRPYNLKIRQKDEEIIRKAARKINELMNDYADIYAFNDQQDLLAMVALHFTAAAIHDENRLDSQDSGIVEKLSEIDQVLTNLF